MLQEKALLVNLSVSLWDAKKLDKNVTREIESNHNASDAGNFSKKLIEKSNVDTYKKLANEARMLVYNSTLPWDNSGNRLLSVKEYQHLSDKLAEIREKFNKAANDFIDSYPNLIENAKYRLNSLFNSSDYPSIQELKRKFNFEMNFYPLLDINDIRININQAEQDKIKAQIEENYRNQFEQAIADLWDNLHKTVKHLAETMQDKDKQFKASTLENVENLVSFLDKYNFNNDTRLDEIKNLINKNLIGFDAETIRQDETEREKLANNAKNVLDKIESYL
jgi:citrate lyase gamma subunit